MNRQGNFFDVFPIIITLFTIGIILIVGLLLVNSISDAINGSGADPNAKRLANEISSQSNWVFDFLFVMTLIALPLFSMIIAFFNNISPLFFYASIGLIVLVIILGSAFGDAWISITQEGSINSIIGNMAMSHYIMSNFGIYALFCAIIISIGIFVKTRSDTGFY
jgi:hypothetical protein